MTETVPTTMVAIVVLRTGAMTTVTIKMTTITISMPTLTNISLITGVCPARFEICV